MEAFSEYARPNTPINGGVAYARGQPPYPVNVPDRGGTEGVMGYTMRTDAYRYTEWIAHSNNNTLIGTAPIGRERGVGNSTRTSPILHQQK